MKNFVFVCQLGENMLRVAKCILGNGNKYELIAIQEEAIPSDIDHKAAADKINQIFKGLDYKHHPVIVCLPRGQATCRYIKVPAQSPAEIEKIVSLQAPRYLPYPAEELITGYQIISKEKEGY